MEEMEDKEAAELQEAGCQAIFNIGMQIRS
jgi:hypothetical protein